MSLLVIRHAPIQLAGRCIGTTDLLPEMPTLEVDAAIDALLDETPLSIWSSPLRRCAEPARRLAERRHIAHHIDPRLSEIHFGEWEGRTWQEIEAEDKRAYDTWMNGWMDVAPPGGESTAHLEARVRSWLRDQEPCVGLVLIGHRGVISALHVILEGASWQDAMARPTPYLQAQQIPSAAALLSH